MKYKWWLFISWLVLLVMAWRYLVDPSVKVVFCDVGQGDGMLLQKGNFQFLVDVGGENQKMLDCLSRYVPFWDKRIEVIVISHWDKDHSGGLEQIHKYYGVEKVYSNELAPVVDEQNVYPTLVGVNDIIRYDGIDFEILSIGDEGGGTNEKSIIGLLRYKDLTAGRQVGVLMLGDTSLEIEQSLVWRGVLRDKVGTVDVLKISHHGSGLATSEELLDEVRPKMAIISVGENNKFGHPTNEVVERLERRGIKVRRTDKDGDVFVTHSTIDK